LAGRLFLAFENAPGILTARLLCDRFDDASLPMNERWLEQAGATRQRSRRRPINHPSMNTADERDDYHADEQIA
jgi:hypothetical protein